MSNSIGTAECLLTGIDKPSLDLKLIDLGLVEHVIVSAEKKILLSFWKYMDNKCLYRLGKKYSS